jgi:hypothetical protein
MKRGMDWYKRDPIAFLGGVQGMSARQIAVFTVVLDLIYQHGGGVHNDPKWIAGWVSDMGGAAVRATLSELIEMGKLTLTDDGLISQERAENQVKTQEKLRENRGKTGKKGGEKSAKNRADANKNKHLDEANTSTRKVAEKSREDITPIVPKGAGCEEQFEIFWRAYPKRDGANPPKPVKPKYAQAIKNGASPDDLLRAVKAYAAEMERKGNIGTGYVMQATKFFNQEIWREYLDKPSSPDAKPGKATIESIPDDRWRREVQHFVDRRGMCQWIFRHLTPPPDDPATLVPPHILAEFNINRAA